jgi:two-component SAPR family response regulator
MAGDAGLAEDDAEDDAAAEEAAADAVSTATEPADDPPVRLDLLGGTLVFVHDRPITILPRERSLLAALAVLGPRPVPRDDLIEALFADDVDGGNTLSHALTDLRAAVRDGGLPHAQARELVRKSSGGYLLNAHVVAVDLWRFDALLREAEGRDEAEAGPLLAEAFALYHGPLCGGEALGFVEEHGYRWMRRVPPALYRLADHYREAGDPKAALHWTRRLLADEPCGDHANQLALNLLAELGDADGLDAHMAEMRERYKADKQKIDSYTLRLYEQLRRKLRDAAEKAG